MRKRIIALVSFVVAVGVFGCSSSSGTTISCTFASTSGLTGVCYQWTSTQTLNQQQISALSSACTSAGTGSTFNEGQNCTSTNRVGTCALTSSVAGVTYDWVFYSPTYNTTSGAAFCNQAGGTWTAG